MKHILQFFIPILLILFYGCNGKTYISPIEEPDIPETPTEEARTYPYKVISSVAELDSIIDSEVYNLYASGKASATFVTDSNIIYSPHEGLWHDCSERMLDWSRSHSEAIIFDGKLFYEVSLEPSFGGNFGPLLAWRALEKTLGEEIPLYIETTLKKDISNESRVFTDKKSRMHYMSEDVFIYSTPEYDAENNEQIFEMYILTKITDDAELSDSYISGKTFREIGDTLTNRIRKTFGDTIDLNKVYYPEKQDPRYIIIKDDIIYLSN